MTMVAEIGVPHSRLLRCSLSVDECRAYWSHVDPADPVGSSAGAFLGSWFGRKSEAWTRELLANMHVRFDPYLAALRVLGRWRSMPADIRRVLCHFHVQLSDPIYRAFTGTFLAGRRGEHRHELHQQSVVGWLGEHGMPRWATKTRLHYASRLLSCAAAAGLVRGRRDPRELIVPRVPDLALEYVLYALRGVSFAGTPLANPYLTSLGLVEDTIVARFRALPSIDLRTMGDVYELHWRYADLETWAAHVLPADEPRPSFATRSHAHEAQP